MRNLNASIILFTVILFICGTETISQGIKGHCRYPMGVQDKRIPDSSLSATSWHSAGTSPKYARLNVDEGDGAWCAKGHLNPNTEVEYLQIKLPQRSFISVVATQGRDSSGRGKEFVKTYKLNYTRDGENWFQWQNFRGNSILSGNKNPTDSNRQLLNPAIQGATAIRFIPVTKRAIVACLRVEMYGCTALSDLVSYDMPTPGDVRRNNDGEFVEKSVYSLSDDRYDGNKDGDSFKGGLGQLTDGVIGASNFENVRSSIPTRKIGYDYVGWTNNNKNDRYITINFNFAKVHNFTKMLIHTLSNKQIKAELFSSVEMAFKLDNTASKLYDTTRTTYNVPESNSETSVVQVPLGVFARSIRACFKMRGSWLLISEVEFVSAEYDSVNTEAIGSGYSRIADNGELVTLQNPVRSTPEQNTTVLIVGVLVAVITLLLLIVLVLAYRQRKLRKTLVPSRFIYRGGNQAINGAPSVTVCIPEQTVTLTPTSCVVNGLETCKNDESIYHEIQGTSSANQNEYLEPKDVIKPTTMPRTLNRSKLSASCSTTSTIPYYAETNLRGMEIPSNVQSIQGLTGSSLYAVPQTISPIPLPRYKKAYDTTSETSTLIASNLEDEKYTFSQEPFVPIEFPREKLTFIEKLGEGQFGEVQLCEADSSLRTLAQKQRLILRGNEKSNVILAVKILRDDAFSETKEGFLKEIKILSELRHPNIVSVIAVCTKDDPYVMAMEYMEHGDLHEYLQGFEMCTHRDEHVTCDDVQLPEIRYHELLSIASQIASGMAYLSSLNLVHRDLAARNCLVGPGNTIQIADFGMSRNMYQSEYYRIQGKAILPIRWMSWECVLMGKFSSASDMWAFGVTLWEIFTLCKCQPYQGLDDDQVIENMHHVYQQDGEEVYLPKPKFCPTGVFKMVHQCWSREADTRPKFDQILEFINERIPANNNLTNEV